MYNDNNENELPILPEAPPGASPLETGPAAKEGRAGDAPAAPAGTEPPDPLDAVLAEIDGRVPPKVPRELRPADLRLLVRDYYYAGINSYFHRTGHDEFIPVGTSSVATRLGLMLRAMGYPVKSLKGLIDEAVIEIQERHYIAACLEVAGFPKGLHTSPAGYRILVQAEARLPEPRETPWESLRDYLEQLFGEDQLPYVFGTLSVFARHLRDLHADPSRVWSRQPLPAVAIAGPKCSGKSLLIALCGAALGGREANPYEYLCGQTRFNSDVAAAELLAIDDQMAAKDAATRARLASGIKQHLFAGGMRIEKKYCNPVHLPCHSILLFAMNEGPDALACLPVIDGSMEDKITLLKAREVRFPPDPAAKERYVQGLFAGIPGFLRYLLEEHRIRDEHRHHRTGIKAFQHPELIEALDDISPETELIEILVAVLLRDYRNKLPDRSEEEVMVWRGKAFELHTLLEDSEKVSELRLRQLLTTKSSLGSRLWALHNRHPEIVRRGGLSKGRRTYEIHLSKRSILRIMPELGDALDDIGEEEG